MIVCMNRYCSPDKPSDYSCFDQESLIAIAEAFNKWKGNLCNKKRCIQTSKIKNIKSLDRHQLYNVLKTKLMDLCSEEYCWADLDFVNSISDNKIKENIKHFTFKPKDAKSSTMWLNTNNINQVIQQYEHAVNKQDGKYTFKFLGAQPCDIYKVVNINFKELQKKYSKVAIVFNNDTHNQPGSHWNSCFIDNKLRSVEFFDSLGELPNKYIKNFINKFKGYALKCNQIVHQTGNFACGIYACHFIIQKLKGKTFNEINARLITDNMMKTYRGEIFRPFQ